MWIGYHLEFYPVVYSGPNLCLFSDVFGCVHPGLLVWPESGSPELLQPPRCLDQLGQPLNQLHPDQCGLPAQAPQVLLLALFPDDHARCLSPPEKKARIVYSFYSMGLWRVCSFSQIPDPGHRAVGRGIWHFQWLLGGSTWSSLELCLKFMPLGHTLKSKKQEIRSVKKINSLSLLPSDSFSGNIQSNQEISRIFLWSYPQYFLLVPCSMVLSPSLLLPGILPPYRA